MRDTLKAAARGASLLAVSPVLAWYVVLARGGREDRVLEGCSQLLALIPGLPGQYMRRAFFARTLAYCGPTSVISFGVIFSAAATRVEDGAYIGPFCTIGLAHIEADTLIAAGAQVPSGPRTHGVGTGASVRDQPGEPRMVRIGPSAWIGNNAVVMADVGRDSIIGAGAIVTKPIPAGMVAAGVPARIIRTRTREALVRG